MHTELPSYNIRRALEPLLMKFGAKQPPFSDDCFLLQDLGIGGDDADEFLEAIHATFGTRFDGFAFATYFPDEHEAVGEHWFRRLGFKDTRKPFRLGHLVDVVQRGAWFEPPEQIEAALPSGGRIRRYAVRGAVAVGMPICYSLAAVGLGEAVGLSPGMSLLLFGLPAAAILAVILWRRLPAN